LVEALQPLANPDACAAVVLAPSLFINRLYAQHHRSSAMNASQPASSSLGVSESERPPSFVNPLIGFVLTTALTSTVMLLLGQL
jgi:hypothetical protein